MLVSSHKPKIYLSKNEKNYLFRIENKLVTITQPVKYLYLPDSSGLPYKYYTNPKIYNKYFGKLWKLFYNN